MTKILKWKLKKDKERINYSPCIYILFNHIDDHFKYIFPYNYLLLITLRLIKKTKLNQLFQSHSLFQRNTFRRNLCKNRLENIIIVNHKECQIIIAQKKRTRKLRIMKRFLGVDHIVQIINTVQDADYELIIMQKGECDLHQYITQSEIISDENLIQITSNIIQGLTSMHEQKEGYWHRDLKPPNIFVFFKNKNDLSKSEKQKILYLGKQKVHAKIGDLGSAKQYIRGTELTQGIGTQPFKCPEIQNQQTKYNNKIDVWSLGLTLFELYTKTSYAEFFYKNPLLCRAEAGCTIIREYLCKMIDSRCKNKFKKMMKDIIQSCIRYYPEKRQTIKNILLNFLNINQYSNITIDEYRAQLENQINQCQNLKIELMEANQIIKKYSNQIQSQIIQNENLKNKLKEVNQLIQTYKQQIKGLQIDKKQKNYQICKLKLQQSIKRINEMEMEIEKCYEVNNNLQNEKSAITAQSKKEIQGLKNIINNITRYQKLSFIKQGGQAYIYLCEDKEEKQKKILRVCSLQQFKCLDIDKTLKQPQILSRLDHPNIIKIEKYWESKSYFKELKPIRSISMILEYIVGGDLSAHIGKLNKFQIKRIYKDVQSALNYLHSKNIIHRDIKSKNILLKNIDKSSITAILTDLGISTILQSYGVTHNTKKFSCSPQYAPPQFISQGKVTIKSDYWSLGVVMLQIALSKSINELRPDKNNIANCEDFPIKQLKMLKSHKDNYIFVEVISKLMKKNPNERTMIQL